MSTFLAAKFFESGMCPSAGVISKLKQGCEV